MILLTSKCHHYVQERKEPSEKGGASEGPPQEVG